MPAASEQLNVDLQQMVDDSKISVTYDNSKGANRGISAQRVDEKLLITKLASYITRREHNAFNAGFKKGERKNERKL